MIISLTGFMGCGKSSVGRRLSELLCCRFMDLDSVIEERTGRSIPKIFASDGEPVFRNIEKNTLKDVFSSNTARRSASLAPSHFVGPSPYAGVRKCQFRTTASPETFAENSHISLQQTTGNESIYENLIVLSLGGGTVMTRECEELVREKSVCVYLRASVETLIRNLQNETEGRPMLAASHDQESPAQDKESCLRARIEDLMIKRSATYESTAHIIIDTDGKTIDCIAEAILSEL